MRFEGLSQATAHAEAESKKSKTEHYVVKSLSGGLHYRVEKDKEAIADGEKILEKYKDGEKAK